MANLTSIDRKYFLSLKPLRYQYVGEEWVTSQLVFKIGEDTILERIEAILQDYELEAIRDAMTNLTEGRETEYVSEFVEPNLTINLNVINEREIKVIADYVEGEDYENRNNEKNYHKHIEFSIDSISVGTFISELGLELGDLKSKQVAK